MNEQVVVGLDIGTDKVKVAAGIVDPKGKMTLLGSGEAPSQGVVRSNIVNIDKTVQAIRSAVQTASQAGNIRIKGANISITGRHIKSKIHHSGITRESEEGEISAEDILRLNKDMYRVVTPPGAEIIHVIPREYAVDYEEGVKDPQGMSGVRLNGNFHVVTAQTNIINNIYKCVNRAGLDIDHLVFSPIASGMAVLTDEEKEMGVCLVNIGASTIELVIYEGGALQHMATIPFGAQTITKDIAQAFMVMEQQAEDLKRKYASAHEEENKHAFIIVPGFRSRPKKEIALSVLSRVTAARMQENVEHIHAEIIRAGFQDKLPGGIVLTGGGAQLHNIERIFRHMTNGMVPSGYSQGYDTRIGYPYERLANQEENLPGIEYGTAIGLALVTNKTLPNIEHPNKQRRHQRATESAEDAQEKPRRQKKFWHLFTKLF